MVMIFCLMPPVRSFAADTVSAVTYWTNPDNSVGSTIVHYNSVKINGSLKDWNSGSYYVDGTVEISDRIKITGDVKLILTDECSLTAKKGIHLKEGNSLTIYGQENSSGTLTAEYGDSYNRNAAIGGNDEENAGDIEIHGGKIIVPQYDSKAFLSLLLTGAGIGGGNNADGGNVTVFNGTVDIQNNARAVSGIGGGWKGNGGTVKIYGGDINTNSGIGGGLEGINGDLYIYGGKTRSIVFSSIKSDGGSITVKGGELYAENKYNAPDTAAIIAEK